MGSTKSELLQVRLTELEKSVITDKAKILGLTVADYVRQCCLFSNATEMFMEKLQGVEADEM